MLEVLEGVHCILPYMLEAVEGARDILIIKKAGGALIVGEIPSQAKPAWLLAKPAWLLDLIKRGLAWLETAWLIASPVHNTTPYVQAMEVERVELVL